jgi:SAM-dependent methyltransferase
VTDYRAVNRANWNERAPAHAASPDYAVDRFLADPSYLSHVVRFDLPRLGDVAGLRGVHLQCHIGTDTISLSRLGARMTGLDFSGASLAVARDLAARAGAEIEYVEAEVYDAPDVLGSAGFDLVFTGVGALCWLPDVARWARVVSALLRPGGRLFIREGHPMLWAIDETRSDGVLAVDYPYFETAEPLVWEEDGTYVATDASFQHNVTHSWNHGLAEVVTAVTAAGLELTMLEEHDSVPWNAIPGRMTRDEHDEYRLTERPERLPCTYTLQARKPA